MTIRGGLAAAGVCLGDISISNIMNYNNITAFSCWLNDNRCQKGRRKMAPRGGKLKLVILIMSRQTVGFAARAHLDITG